MRLLHTLPAIDTVCFGAPYGSYGSVGRVSWKRVSRLHSCFDFVVVRPVEGLSFPILGGMRMWVEEYSRVQ